MRDATPQTTGDGARQDASRRLGEIWPVVQDLGRSLAAALVLAWSEPASSSTWRRRVRLPIVGVVGVDLLLVVDAVVTLVLWGVTAGSLQYANTTAGGPYSGEFTLALAAMSTVPLLARSRWPLAAWRAALVGLVVASVSLQDLVPYPVAPGGVVAYLLCLYSVAVRTDRDVAVGAWLVSVVTIVGVGVPVRDEVAYWPTVVVAAATVAVPLVFGHNVRERRRAQTDVATERRRTVEERAARAVLEERSRIARELHDVVAHHMSMIAIQAEAAPLRAPEAPDVVKADLAHIRRTALEALQEMRRVLGVLRQDDDRPEAAPQPGLDRLPELAENAEAAGLAVALKVSTVPGDLPPGVGVSAYRIVQESLSNVMRHAPGAAVRVDVALGDDPAEVIVRVENDPPPGPESAPADRDGTGHGLVGMRERAGMLGGHLRAGPTDAGGFVVVATLPLDRR